ncbi:MAG: TolC family protein [Fimbriimonadaceae bacterium]|nr:TolC family protein [Fimbriimonadaceae bacterium]
MRLFVAVIALLPAGIALGQNPPLDLLAAVRLAEQSRPSIRAAEARLRQSEFNLRASPLLLPLRIEAALSSTPSFGGEDLLLAEPIDLFGKNRSIRGVASSNIVLSRAQFRQARLDLQTEVLNAYAEVIAAQIQLRTSAELLDVQQRLFDATKKRVDQGDLPPVDLTRAGLDLERTKTMSVVNEQSLKAARQRLSAAIGRPIAVDVDETAIIPVQDAAPDRPDVQGLRATLDSSRWDLRGSRSSLMPDFEIQFRRSPWTDPEQYNLRLQLVWNVFDWGAGSNRVRSAKAGIEAATKDLEDRQRSSAVEVVAAEADVSAAQTSVGSLAKLEATAFALVQQEQRGFEGGGNTLLAVLEATRALRDIQASSADAKLRLLQAQAKLMAARGVILTELK